mgnify:CR=1 FL=1
MNGAAEISIPNATVSEGVSVSTSNHSATDNADETIPQWKREFLAKKKALMMHQQARLKQVAVAPLSDSETTDTDRDNSPLLSSRARNEVKVNGTVAEISVAAGGEVVSNGGYLPAESADEEDVVTEEDGHDDSSSSVDEGDSTDDELVDGKSGGYSFITAEKYVPESVADEATRNSPELIVVTENRRSPVTVVSSKQQEKERESSSPSLVDSNAASDSAENDTDNSSNELPYRPGFVSKLLNKWSSISYQTQSQQPSNYTPQSSGTRPSPISSINNSVSPAPSTSTSTTEEQQDSNYTLRNTRSGSAIASAAELTHAPQRSVSADAHRTSSRAERPSSGILSSGDTDEGVSDSVSEELVKRRSSYRAPSEIILIESPREQLREGSVSEDRLPELSVDTSTEITQYNTEGSSPNR